MKTLLARVKQLGTWAYFLLPLLVLGLLWLAYRLAFPKAKPKMFPDTAADNALTHALNETQARLAEANNKAAVEIAVARTTEVTHRAELDNVLAIPNAAQRRRALIAMRQRHAP